MIATASNRSFAKEDISNRQICCLSHMSDHFRILLSNPDLRCNDVNYDLRSRNVSLYASLHNNGLNDFGGRSLKV